MKAILSLTFAVIVVSASAGVDMDHISPRGTDLINTPKFAVMQIFPDFPTFSASLGDDFIATGTSISEAGVAFEVSQSNPDLHHIQGWQVSVWADPADAVASGSFLNQGTVTQALVSGNHFEDITPLAGTGGTDPAFELSLTGLNIGGLTVGGHYYFAMAPVLPFVDNGQIWIMSNKFPAVVGAGVPYNSFGFNPGGGWGMGTYIPIGSNAAYRVVTIPEPMTLTALAVALTAVTRMRRLRA